jgi:hypothetical protein
MPQFTKKSGWFFSSGLAVGFDRAVRRFGQKMLKTQTLIRTGENELSIAVCFYT